MSKNIFKSFYFLTKLAYSIAIPSALTSALCTFIFQLRMIIGPENHNHDETQNEEEQNHELEGVLIFDIPLPSLLH